MLISWEVWFLYGLSVLCLFMLALFINSRLRDYEYGEEHMSKFSAVQQNLAATRPERENNQWMGHRKQLCLRCQKDKKTKGGSLTWIGTFKKFICSDCVTAKLQEKNT